VAERFKISRDEMDRFALESHRRAASASQEGRFREQIVPVDVPGAGRVEVDEGIRIDTSLEKLAKLPPVFREDGQVTAGNASQLSDGGAAMVVLRSEEHTSELQSRFDLVCRLLLEKKKIGVLAVAMLPLTMR